MSQEIFLKDAGRVGVYTRWDWVPRPKKASQPQIKGFILMKHLTSNDFEDEVIQSPVPVLVDFWAEWCAPCRALKPVLEALAQELAGQAKIVAINVQDYPDTAGTFQVHSIPTLLVFHSGEVVEKAVGVKTRDDLLALLNPYIQGKAKG